MVEPPRTTRAHGATRSEATARSRSNTGASHGAPRHARRRAAGRSHGRWRRAVRARSHRAPRATGLARRSGAQRRGDERPRGPPASHAARCPGRRRLRRASGPPCRLGRANASSGRKDEPAPGAPRRHPRPRRSQRRGQDGDGDQQRARGQGARTLAVRPPTRGQGPPRRRESPRAARRPSGPAPRARRSAAANARPLCATRSPNPNARAASERHPGHLPHAIRLRRRRRRDRSQARVHDGRQRAGIDAHRPRDRLAAAHVGAHDLEHVARRLAPQGRQRAVVDRAGVGEDDHRRLARRRASRGSSGAGRGRRRRAATTRRCATPFRRARSRRVLTQSTRQPTSKVKSPRMRRLRVVHRHAQRVVVATVEVRREGAPVFGGDGHGRVEHGGRLDVLEVDPVHRARGPRASALSREATRRRRDRRGSRRPRPSGAPPARRSRARSPSAHRAPPPSRLPTVGTCATTNTRSRPGAAKFRSSSFRSRA